MLFDVKHNQLWSFTELRKHHKEHHEREDELLKLLREIKGLLVSFTTEGSNGQELFDILVLIETELAKELGDGDPRQRPQP